MTPQEMVREFHEKFGHPTNDSLTSLSVSLRELRLTLIEEEFYELIAACGFNWMLDHEEGRVQDPIEMADALGDLIYVIYGTAICMGIDLDRVVEEIHRSNMSKLGEDGNPIMREDGKILKGPNYSAPNLAPIIGL